MNTLEEIRKRFLNQGIEIEDCYLFFDNKFEGQKVESYCPSKDNNFMCIVFNNKLLKETDFNIDVFEIKDIYNTYLSNGEMSYLTNIYLLYKK